MKTDYEFIKDKFDESEVKAPDSLNEDFVLKKLGDIKPKKNRKPLYAGLSLAAAVALFTAVALIFTSVASNLTAPITIKSGNSGLANFASVGDVKKALRKIYKERAVINGYIKYSAQTELFDFQPNNLAGSGAISSKAADYGHNATYTQYTNVDEADTVKTDGRYIYYLDDSSKIDIFSTEGKKSKKVAEIYSPSNKKYDCFAYYFNDFYIYGDKLIATANRVEDERYNNVYTTVEIFDVSDINNIKLTDSFDQSGSYCSSRMIDNMLYVVSTHTAENEEDIPRAGKPRESTGDEATPDELPCGNIYTVENPSDTNFLVVSSINTDNGAQAVNTKAILGSADTVYCNTEHLFVTAEQFDYHRYEKLAKNPVIDFYMTASYTQIVKVDLTDDLNFTATTKVKGYVDNQYALDEKDGYLRVATTTDTDGKNTNRLYVFDKNLKQVGKTESFAKDESIKAVRYIGDTAYVITYEETDPLFVIDTSDVTSPKILGEVKISGFSTMLVPVDDNTLLGIGYHTQDEDDDINMEIEEGIKLALFDVSDKANPKVLDEKIFKDYISEVQYNPKALLVNFERNDYTIPFEHYIDKYDEYITKYGVINFKVENKKIKIVDEYTSKKFAENDDEYCYLERCAYVDNYIYMLGTDRDVTNESRLHLTAEIDAVEYK